VKFSEEEKAFIRTVGNVLRIQRKKNGYTSSITLATDLEMSSSLYGQYERGENMKLISLFRLLKLMKINVPTFLIQVALFLREQEKGEI